MSHSDSDPFPRRADRRSTGGSQQSTAGQAKDAAADVAGHGQQAAADVARTGQQAAGQVAGEAKDRASDLLGKTKIQVNEQVEVQRTSAVQTLRDLGEQLAAMTDHVEQQGTAIDAATTARDRVRGAADWLDQRDGAQVLHEVRQFGRQRPGTFLGLAALAGVVAGRLTRGVVAEHTDTEHADTGAGSERPTGHDAGRDSAWSTRSVTQGWPGHE
ncbi:hypothetical protein [Allobranchiibius sp. CTAmp26]|uniref:hypothetical protein n=1 Tax=Allobranchiibius sp. CTAmp26 TaxID=2815214 RepID=UPI001AA141FC|nr:hypothetical protein [Allobranchiibius sp. CTAmp26]MBO1756494.1 hypothetical protein [Allobranchiibius sp. CTAmp26]